MKHLGDITKIKGSCLWASEIEEFPIDVAKLHFPEGESKE